ncbi:VTT domain-containing protein [Jannaschia sp. Os4]|uniref:DedA family protein n=1 Tax=Jannaschia sp. Os4 TaxID=2807617 RepID=UPI00193A1C26|nr:VTT domain-containing protein [Jannaschia sp. Os4]MBM2576997.1 VTT domain-containing protein [Jannaschia sp. Os4]
MIDAVLGWVSDNRDWAFLIAFLFALAETTLIVSAFIPSTAILFGIGGLVAAGYLDFMPLFLGAALGAVTGSLLSWAAGRFYGPALLKLGPMRRRREKMRRARLAFKKWGAPAVTVGHLGGPLRAVAFTLSGLTAMPLWTFLPFTILGAFAWAWATIMAGKLGGDLLGALF